MGTQHPTLSRWKLHGLLILAYFGSLCVGQEFVDDYAQLTKGGLTCYVCNSLVEPCKDDVGVKLDCKEYLKTVYGEDGSSAAPLKLWPLSLSEQAARNPDDLGWTLGAGFPSSYENGKNLTYLTDPTHRFSSYSNMMQNGGKLTMRHGFRSCKTMKITVDSSINGNKRGEIPKDEPRVIRSCSFNSVKDKLADKSYNDKGCRKYQYKEALVEVCYCKGNNCNGSPYLQMSSWMFGVSILVLLTQIL